MALLPGQVNTKGGVSNLLFGTNIANYAIGQFNAGAQSVIKASGATVLRIPLTDQSSNPWSDAQLANLVAGCKASGAVMLGILPHSQVPYCQHAVTYLGNNCLLYEYRNEPDLNPTASPSSYTAEWNALIPTLRKINPKAAFIGPVLGVVANFNAWMVPFLAGAKTAGTLPDAVSFHDYPCTSHPTQAVCQTKTGNIGNDTNRLAALIKSTAGVAIPIAVTEWNVDASANLASYATSAAFVTPWQVAALEGMAAAGVVLANEFNSNSTAGVANWIAAAAIKTEVTKYQAGATPPAGITGGSTAAAPGTGGGTILSQVSNVLTSVFGGANYVPVPGITITLVPNADVSQLLAVLDQYMLINNPFIDHMANVPQDSIGSISFTDPFSWVEQFGTNLVYDMGAFFLRSLFAFIGVMVLIKVISEFIDFEALGQAIGQGVGKAAMFAALV